MFRGDRGRCGKQSEVEQIEVEKSEVERKGMGRRGLLAVEQSGRDSLVGEVTAPSTTVRAQGRFREDAIAAGRVGPATSIH